MRFTLLFIALAWLPIAATAQHRTCGTMAHHEWLLQQNPQMAREMEAIEAHTHAYEQGLAQGQAHLKTAAVVTIPVVVHVLYRTGTENISDLQIQSQLAVLNNDFRRLNADRTNTPSAFTGVAADAEIQFCLASRDANGNATTGIIRRLTTVTSFSANDAMKFTAQGGSDAWPASHYLNVWVCNLGGGLLGYAQFPGGPANTDGVVCGFNYFGTTGAVVAPYNKGRTMTHEVGHWLNLRHIWGDATCATDLVSDTPTQSDANYGCPSHPKPSCNNTADMFMNYMDYTDDACMNIFTTGQKNRMRALFTGSRASLTTSMGCTPPTATCAVPAGLGATGITTTAATLNWGAVAGAASGYNVRFRAVGATTWATVAKTTTNHALTGLTAATQYEFQVQSRCSATTTSAYSASAAFTTSSATATCAAPAGLGATGITTTTATLNWGAVAGAASGYNVRFRAVGATTWATVAKTTTNHALTGLMAATQYEFQVQSRCSASLTGAFSASATFATTATGTNCATDSREPNNTIAAAAALTPNTNNTAFICPATDVDWFGFSNSSTQRNIRITLDLLPADYDVYLYNPSGSLVGSSENGGTTAETITLNNGATGNYRIEVRGYNGAFSATASYRIRAGISSTAYRTLPDAAEAEASPDAALTVFPNPTQGNLNLAFSLPTAQEVNLTLVNLMGQVMLAHTFWSEAGEQSLPLALDAVSNGLYLLQFSSPGLSQTIRVQVAR